MNDECLENPFEEEPHGWIQWKGTDVCMDAYCECGEMFHIDAEFAYAVICPYCEAVYEVNGHVKFHKVDKSRANEGCCIRGER